MVPGKYNIVCPKGSTLSQQMTYSINDVPVNLSGYSARMQVREKYESTSFITSLTSNNGGIILNSASAGIIGIYISSSATGSFIAKDYLWDMEIISPSNIVTRLLEGKFLVTPEVTR
jgi:hypothetical protein